MDINVTSSIPNKLKNGCLVIPLLIGKKLSPVAAEADKKTDKAISRAIKRGDINDDAGSHVILHEVTGVPTDRLLLIAHSAKTLPQTKLRRICNGIAKALSNSGADRYVIQLDTTLLDDDANTKWFTQTLAQALIDSQYKFTLHHNKKVAAVKPKHCTIVVPKSNVKACNSATKNGVAIANGQAKARDLGNLAPNICTPTYLAKQAQALAKAQSKLTTKIVTEAQMKKMGMGAFLSVSQGSRQEAKLICMEYRGADAKQKPIVLLGKGITFDTGGISIKPSAAMDEMKFDMCGAASVFGAMHALTEIQPKANVIGVVAAAENMPDGAASRPGDVVTTMSGQTVEILNTDAEGRLVLCDSLTYVERYKPAAVIDVATLTGATVVALGKVTSAIMSNDKSLANALYDAGQDTGDLAWELPLWDEYQAQLHSNFADMGNIGGSPAGAITAGCFLSRFAEKYKWAHLDIAGVAWKGGAQKGATGRPVPLLMDYVLNKA